MRHLVRIALLLVGFGNVARRFVTLLEESRAALTTIGIEPVIVGVVTRRHGGDLNEAGLDATRLAQVAAGGGAVGPATAPSALEWFARLRSQGIEARVLG